jgi:hypothetical protein
MEAAIVESTLYNSTLIIHWVVAIIMFFVMCSFVAFSWLYVFKNKDKYPSEFSALMARKADILCQLSKENRERLNKKAEEESIKGQINNNYQIEIIKRNKLLK